MALEDDVARVNACQDLRERIAKWGDSLSRTSVKDDFIPAWWGFRRLTGGDVIGTINDRSNDPTAWLIVALILGLFFLLPRTEQAKPIAAPVVAVASPQGTVSFYRQSSNGTRVLITSEPGKEVNGQIITPDGRVWTRNQDGTLSEVK